MPTTTTTTTTSATRIPSLMHTFFGQWSIPPPSMELTLTNDGQIHPICQILGHRCILISQLVRLLILLVALTTAATTATTTTT